MGTETVKAPAKPRLRRPDKDTVFTIQDDGSRNFIHTADVKGRWQVRRNLVYWVLIAIYTALPWIKIGGRPSILLDLPGRHADVFGMTFTNQDFYLVFFLVTGLGFGLFALTALLGRVWCGYACPHTVFLEAVYRKVERWIEGSREMRIRRNARPVSFDKFWRKGLKHLLYIAFSFTIAHIFLSYFIPVDRLFGVLRSGPSGQWVVFGWTLFWTGLLYFDYSWFREQTCLVICPYGRFQSALIDADTINIGYDSKRGEPRSKKATEGGDCIDCFRCVVVCPTGIDIRNGLQMECIGCSNCIDACDEIMEKVGRPKGLVRYDSLRGFEDGVRRSFFRPRVLLYGVLGLIGIAVSAFVISGRSPFEARALRPRGLPYVLEEQTIRNGYTLHLQNKGSEATTYLIDPVELDPEVGVEPEYIFPQRRVRLDGLSDLRVPFFVRVPRESFRGAFPLTVTVRDSVTGYEKAVEIRFRGPS